MKRMFAAIIGLGVMTMSVSAGAVDFASDEIGAPPKGWIVTMTGEGKPKWTVEKDDSALSNGKIFQQSGEATFPLAFMEGSHIKDGFIEVRFKAISGTEDRAAGIVWRAKDANNYYIVRANALEDNVVPYKTVNGERITLDMVGRKEVYGVAAPVPANQWHKLRVEFAGPRFKVIFNGEVLFEVDDTTFADAGMVGLWTKADSVTAFDGFNHGEKK